MLASIYSLYVKDYLVLVDTYSKGPDCHELRRCTSRDMISILSKIFLDFGTPETIMSVNATYFTSHEFGYFMIGNEVKHVTVSQWFG